MAQEIYDSVLKGEFNDVTLQQINDYINDVTPKNPYGRRVSQRLPQAVERSLYEGARTNTIDALFSRICESAVSANGRFSEGGRRAIEERKKEALKGWAIATGNWHTDISDFVADETPIGEGTDSKVYLSKDGKHVIKLSKGKPYGKRFRPDIDNIPLFNLIFPNSAYTILGYGEIDGNFVRILQQPFVDFATSTPLTKEERVEYMTSLGFYPLNDGAIERKKKQAIREGGLSSHSKVQLPILLISCLLPTKLITILEKTKMMTLSIHFAMMMAYLTPIKLHSSKRAKVKIETSSTFSKKQKMERII